MSWIFETIYLAITNHFFLYGLCIGVFIGWSAGIWFCEKFTGRIKGAERVKFKHNIRNDFRKCLDKLSAASNTETLKIISSYRSHICVICSEIYAFKHKTIKIKRLFEKAEKIAPVSKAKAIISISKASKIIES